MANSNLTYRIRTDVGADPGVLNVKLDSTYNLFEILSLKITQEDVYRLYSSDYGVLVGRVLANGGFGIPNAKISCFIEVSDEDAADTKLNFLYPYVSTKSTNEEGIRYNTLPDEQVNECHQYVGTFPNKRLVLDNGTVLEIFEKYWKYTTVSNNAGDFMLFAVPTGQQQLHVDLDMSDIGPLSQRPRDMIYKGYNINQFESPNKFKQSTNLASLPQIYSQDTGVFVYPFWGDSTNDDVVGITRCDIQISYQFEPTAIFIGSIATDTGSNAIGKSCTPNSEMGRVDKLMASEGSIEMIRKTEAGIVEAFQIKGDRVIDGDGVWCYQIPMNLDYVKTDEYGNIVPTDDPTSGIPTRARVRFRVSVDGTGEDNTGRKQCRYLVPNNPFVDKVNGQEISDGPNPLFTRTKEFDYEFGTATRDESFRDLFWNKVYTVKSYIPRIQTGDNPTTRDYTGIKWASFYGNNNPFPYNQISIKLPFTHRIICVIVKVIIYVITVINGILSLMAEPICRFCKILDGLCRFPIKWLIRPLKNFVCALVPSCIELSSEFCTVTSVKYRFFPGCLSCLRDKAEDEVNASNEEALQNGDASSYAVPSFDADADSVLMNCIETELAQENEVVSFTFANDWINGFLYFPLWHRYIRPKKKFLFGLFTKRAKDQWCDYNNTALSRTVLIRYCDLTRSPNNGEEYVNNYGERIVPYATINLTGDNSMCTGSGDADYNCYEKYTKIKIGRGVVISRTTLDGATVYYYCAGFYDPTLNDVVRLFATDIVLLGSLSDCDLDGIPQFFRNLESTTYKLPTPLVSSNSEIVTSADGDLSMDTETESSGLDWAISDGDQCGGLDGGLFYGIGCSNMGVHAKSCINLERLCEYGVELDQTTTVRDLEQGPTDSEEANQRLVADGYVSKDELVNVTPRSMFATMNGNDLKTKISTADGLKRYEMNYLYPENFDGQLSGMMESSQRSCNKSYRYNYNLEVFNRDYYRFRMGEQPFFYGGSNTSPSFPRFNNSFYFYFGLHPGKTALEQFNSNFFAPCTNTESSPFNTNYILYPSTWCGDSNGSILLDVTDIELPYSVVINGVTDTTYTREYSNLEDEKVCLGAMVEGYEDYVQVPDDDGSVDGFSNGEYEMTITDANGSVVSQSISLTPAYLTFSTTITPFRYDNDTLLSNYGSFNAVRQAKLASDETSAKVGGQINITGVYVNDEELFPIGEDGYIKDHTGNPCDETRRGYKITMQKTVFETVVNDDGTTGSTSTTTDIELTDKEVLSGKLECDQGNAQYTVKITEYCMDDDCRFTLPSDNSMTSKITVNEPTPVKLYINGVDYDLIRNFKSGWVINRETYTQRPSDFCGWDQLAEVENPYYNWDAIDFEGMTDEEIAQKKEEIVNDVKNAFWIQCETDYKDLKLMATSDYPPYTYGIMGYLETVTYDDYGNQTAEIDTIPTTIAEDTWEDITTPTLLSKESDNAGSVVNNYAKLNADRPPFAVAFVDSNESTLPVNADIDADDVEGSNKSNWFLVHFIDKRFKINMTVWAGQTDPVYYLQEPSTWGEIVDNGNRYNGFLRATIENGVCNNTRLGAPLYCRSWWKAEFGEATIGNKELLIETLTMKANGEPDENAIPTMRRVVGAPNSKFPFPCTDEEMDFTAVEVDLRSMDIGLTSDDGGCDLYEDVYGNLRISPVEVVNDCRDDSQKRAIVSMRNGDDGVDNTYVCLYYDDATYPYPNHEYMAITGESAVYASGVTVEDLINRGGSSGIGANSITTTDAEGNTATTVTYGYGETGSFLNLTRYRNPLIPRDTEPKIYIIGITRNNCRCMSPVYDFGYVNAMYMFTTEIEIVTGDTEVDVEVDADVNVTGDTGEEGGDVSGSGSGSGSGTGTTTTEITHYFMHIKLGECRQWYMQNFESDVMFTFSSDKVNVQTEKHVTPDELMDSFTFELTMDEFNSIARRATSTEALLGYEYVPISEADMSTYGTFTITDVTGMQTIANLSSGLFAV